MTPIRSPSVGKTIETKIRQRWRDLKDEDRDAFAAVLTDDNTQVWGDGKGARDKTTAVNDLDKWTPIANSCAFLVCGLLPATSNQCAVVSRAERRGQCNRLHNVLQLFTRRRDTCLRRSWQRDRNEFLKE